MWVCTLCPGLVAFTNGLMPTIYRNCVWNAVYFGLMHKLKTFLPVPETPSHWVKASYTAVTGSSAAAFAVLFNARKSEELFISILA